MIKIRKLGKMSEKNNRISFHEMEEYGMILQTCMEGYRYVRRVIERSGQSAYLLGWKRSSVGEGRTPWQSCRGTRTGNP